MTRISRRIILYLVYDNHNTSSSYVKVDRVLKLCNLLYKHMHYMKLGHYKHDTIIQYNRDTI